MMINIKGKQVENTLKSYFDERVYLAKLTRVKSVVSKSWTIIKGPSIIMSGTLGKTIEPSSMACRVTGAAVSPLKNT